MHFEWHSVARPVTVTSTSIRLYNTCMTLIPNLVFTELRSVSMEHFRRQGLGTAYPSGQLNIPSVLVLAYDLMIETSFPKTAEYFQLFSIRISRHTYSIFKTRLFFKICSRRSHRSLKMQQWHVLSQYMYIVIRFSYTCILWKLIIKP